MQKHPPQDWNGLRTAERSCRPSVAVSPQKALGCVPARYLGIESRSQLNLGKGTFPPHAQVSVRQRDSGRGASWSASQHTRHWGAVKKWCNPLTGKPPKNELLGGQFNHDSATASHIGRHRSAGCSERGTKGKHETTWSRVRIVLSGLCVLRPRARHSSYDTTRRHSGDRTVEVS